MQMCYYITIIFCPYFNAGLSSSVAVQWHGKLNSVFVCFQGLQVTATSVTWTELASSNFLLLQCFIKFVT